MKPSLAALAFGVLLSGCSQRAPEPSLPPAVPRPIASVPAPAPTVTAVAVADPVSTYTYVPASKRDPFRVDFRAASRSASAAKLRRAALPLQPR